VRFRTAAVGGIWAVAACATTPARPSAPAPEYERPRLAPWDAGAATDLPDLDQVLYDAAEGEWIEVDEGAEEPAQADAGSGSAGGEAGGAGAPGADRRAEAGAPAD